MRDVTIGQFFPGDSLVHRLDPRTKIILTFAFIISLFFVDTFSAYAGYALYIFGVLSIAKIPPKIVLRGMKSLALIILITMILNIFMIDGEPLFHIGRWTATVEGLRFALFMVLRIVFLVMGSSLLTLTTSPIRLTDGLEKIMGPLKYLRVPVHELAMMMTIALRFIPTLMEETDKIMKAQKARGADFETGGILTRAKNLIPILVPLFINAFRRADELAGAMEARLYRGGEGRTKLHELHYTRLDLYTLIPVLAFFAALSFGLNAVGWVL